MSQDGSESGTPDGITRARFRVLTGPNAGGGGSGGTTLDVHFNPESLEYTVTNNIQQRGNSNTNKQYVSQSSGKLTMDLVFDTTSTGDDVRRFTDQFQRMMKPAEEGRKQVASVVQFEWGAYRFKGILESYKETIDFFSSTGVPLRASANITLAQQEGLFEPTSEPADANPPTVQVPQPSGRPVAQTTGDPETARELSEANGEENPRLPSGDDLQAPDEPELRPPSGFAPSGPPGVELGAGGGLEIGGDFGIEGGAGFGIEGDAGFGIEGDAGFGIEGGAGFGMGASAGFGVEGSASFGVEGSAGFGASGSAAVEAGFGGSPSAGFGASAGVSSRAELAGSEGPGIASGTNVHVTRSAGFEVTHATSSHGFARPADDPQDGPAGGPAWGARASAGVPAAYGAFSGLRRKTRRRTRTFRPHEALAPQPEASLHTDDGAQFRIGGQAIQPGPAGLRADVGARASLNRARIEFEEE